jgi:hypothetical protein
MEIGTEFLSASILATIAIGLGAGLLRGFSGFGGSIFAVPLLSIVYDPAVAVAVMLGAGTIGTPQLIPGALPLTQWRETLPLIVLTLVATPIGTYVLLTGDPDMIRRGIGIFVLLAALLMMWGWSWRGPRTHGISGFVGVVSGIVTGLAGMGGSIATLYLISSSQPVAVIRANLIIIIGAMNVIGFGYLIAGGALTASTLVNVAIFTPTYIFSIWIGTRIFRGTSDVMYRRLALWLLIAVGIAATIA